MTMVVPKRLWMLLTSLLGVGLTFALFQNATYPTGATTTCSVAGQISNQNGVPQFCDGSRLVSMKNSAIGGCSAAGMISTNGGDIFFCDGGTNWSIRGSALGSCSAGGMLAWNGSAMTVCLAGTLYSASTPTFAIQQAFHRVLGRAPTGSEINNILGGVNLSLVSYDNVLSIVQQGLSQNPSLASSTDAAWSLGGGGAVSVATTACGGGLTVQNGSCVAAVCSPNAIQSCWMGSNYGVQTCNGNGSAWGSCQAPGHITGQNVVDNFVEVRSQPGKSFYNYAPDMIYENGLYHMYWCAGVGDRGDYILHAQSNVPSGPFHASNNAASFSYDVALQPTWNSANFDGFEACDPSVIKVGSTYVMYYSGLATQSNNTAPTKIGVAVSSDAVHFGRANGGNPIVNAAGWTPNTKAYGAGQPSVYYVAPYFYMSFTDTTAAGGLGQYMLRSTDVFFQSGNEELIGPNAWVARAAMSRSGQYRYLSAYSVDITYDTMSKKILVASNQVGGQHWIYVMDPTTLANYGYFSMAGTWTDGASIVKNPDRTLLGRGACQSLDLQVYKGAVPPGLDDTLIANTNISRSQAQFQLLPSVCGQ